MLFNKKNLKVNKKSKIEKKESMKENTKSSHKKNKEIRPFNYKESFRSKEKTAKAKIKSQTSKRTTRKLNNLVNKRTHIILIRSLLTITTTKTETITNKAIEAQINMSKKDGATTKIRTETENLTNSRKTSLSISKELSSRKQAETKLNTKKSKKSKDTEAMTKIRICQKDVMLVKTSSNNKLIHHGKPNKISKNKFS